MGVGTDGEGGDPVMESTPLLWTTLALAYCLAGVYLRAFDSYDHPIWVWGSFLFTGSALFMLVNHRHFFNDVTSIGGAFELATIIAAAVLGHSLFIAARSRAKAIEESDTLRDNLDEYKALIDHSDIDITYNRENDDERQH